MAGADGAYCTVGGSVARSCASCLWPRSLRTSTELPSAAAEAVAESAWSARCFVHDAREASASHMEPSSKVRLVQRLIWWRIAKLRRRFALE